MKDLKIKGVEALDAKEFPKQKNQLKELKFEDLKSIDGGNPLALGITLFMFAAYLYNEGGDFIEGFKEGYNG